MIFGWYYTISTFKAFLLYDRVAFQVLLMESLENAVSCSLKGVGLHEKRERER